MFLFQPFFFLFCFFPQNYCEHEIGIDAPCHKDYTSGPKVDVFFFLTPCFQLVEIWDLSGVVCCHSFQLEMEEVDVYTNREHSGWCCMVI